MSAATEPFLQATPSGGPAVSVIIPTFNRSSALLTCLEHLERQTFTGFEVIIVDDGSTDSTPQDVATYCTSTPLRVRYVAQPNAGPARARNVGMALAAAPLCLLLGDDIFATPPLVAAHVELHRARPAIEVAALGLTRWSETGQTVTPFMRWLDESCTQFSYPDLLRGVRPGWRHFYTSNLSVKTELLRLNPFNESFTRATMEDIELGYRLERQHRLDLVFLPGALASHLHPTTFLQACRRLHGVGRSIHRFHQLWPEHRPAGPGRLRRIVSSAIHGMPWLLPPLTAVANLLTRVWCPNPLMRRVLALHTAAGYRSHQSGTCR